ncbi:hypothetical protein HXX76_003838 [Chlamydomonas incerta]|uniref:Uncharacterized protein n=1 Tax=Chlamydomonas incerta TaxID=51695 RepID=A0A835TLD5_CHLIN|nr:hypothetical protein HXX76_003838 [Chlamydomonas incerta]|eukprot:KAG2440985.1 hypothetical protein HXX76_003838 [Chlamydomonas incerta]
MGDNSAHKSAFVLLEPPELKKLADLIHKQELILIKNQRQPDIHHFKQLCEDSLAARDTILDALANAQRVYDEIAKSEAAADSLKRKVAEDHFHYIKNGANNALQNIRNFGIRREYAKKIAAHSEEIVEQLVSINLKTADLESLAQYCSNYRNAMLDIARSQQTPTSRAFSKVLKESGVEFHELVSRYQTKLNETGFPALDNVLDAEGKPIMVGKGSFKGQFSDLTEMQKIQVYEEVIKASGRANPFISKLSKGLGAAGVALMVLGVGLLAWDVFESAHPIETAVRGVMDAALGIGGALIGEAVGTTIAAGLLSAGAESTPVFVLMAGMAGGLAGAFIVGAIVGLIVGIILGTAGGASPLTPLTSGMKACLIELPDGRALARRIHGMHIEEASG